MKLDEILKSRNGVPGPADHAVIYFHGAIEADHDPSYFSVYRRPNNRHSYMLVKKSDVEDEFTSGRLTKPSKLAWWVESISFSATDRY